MKTALTTVAATALLSNAALAGGVDRSGQGINFMFEQGNYVEFSFGTVDPSVSGVGAGVVPNPAQPTPGASSGDMTNSYANFATAFKIAVSDSVDIGFVLDEPFGASVTYPTGTGYFGAGSDAELNATAITGLVRYKMPNNFSVHGGVRLQSFGARAFIPFATAVPGVTPPYTGRTGTEHDLGYLIGAAYERPDIALRIALTYNSKIKHDLPTTETSVLGASTSTTTTETPQSVNLDFQTGIAQDTLLFGGVRWVNWSDFAIAPQDYNLITGGIPLVSYDDDTFTYTLGVGRRFNDTWSGALSLIHEPATGGFASNLGPTDGYTAVGIGGTYTQDNMKITAGLRYIWIGDAQTQLGGSGIAASNFTDNTALAFGMRVGFSF